MALARLKVWGQEILTFEDLNAEFDNILNNATNLISPLTGTLDLNGNQVILDAAGASIFQSTASRALDFTTLGAKTGTPGTSGSLLAIGSHGFTDNNTASSGTAAAYTGVSFARPTLIASNTTVTTTDAATVYIANSPLASTNETVTNPWSLWIDAGNVRVDGDLTFHTASTGTGGNNNIVLQNANAVASMNAAGSAAIPVVVFDATDQIQVGPSSGTAVRVRLDGQTTNRVHIPVVATASLPAAGATENGSILIEDNGAGDRNVIIYAGGQRFRIDGGAAV